MQIHPHVLFISTD